MRRQDTVEMNGNRCHLQAVSPMKCGYRRQWTEIPWYPGRVSHREYWRGLQRIARDYSGPAFNLTLALTVYILSMLVEVVELRVTGMKLTPEEVAEAKRHRGNLTFHKGWLYLNRGFDTSLDQVITPLHGAQLVKLSGDDMMWTGEQFIRVADRMVPHRQGWWCKLLQGPPEPGSPLFQRR